MVTHSLELAASDSQQSESDGQPCGPARSSPQHGLFTLPDSDTTGSGSTPTSGSRRISRKSTSSRVDSPVRISALRGAAKGWPAAKAAFSLNSFAFWERLGLSGSFLRTSLVCCRAIEAATWESFSPRWSNAGTASRGGFSTVSFSESPNAAAECSLSDILQATSDVPQRFYLSPKACAGILRRCVRRGVTLPSALRHALTRVATRQPTSSSWLERSRSLTAGGASMRKRQETTTSLSVRRLTPTECERLQGFPDHWTCVKSAKKGLIATDIEDSATP